MKEEHEPGAAVVAGPPLAVLDDLHNGPRFDDLLRRAAAGAPGRIALRTPEEELTYGEFDRRVSGFAAALRQLAGADAVVALAMELSLSYPVALYGISRAGAVSALINPLLPADRLVALLHRADAAAVVVAPDLAVELRDQFPAQYVLTHRDPDIDTGALPTVHEMTVRADDPVPAASEGVFDTAACLQFTSGTTGDPKICRLSHRNLVVNAAQTAYAHRLGGSSVVFNFLPTFHSMHLHISVTAAATHVLWPDPDILGAVAGAHRNSATHFYSLPVRLMRLAADPALGETKADALRAILSGGSAMSAGAIADLSAHFGVPVVQGYGLAETAPSVFLGNLDDPRPGSCGIPVPGAECRIVDVETRAVQRVGAKGEIQVRGPQLMLGYLGRPLGADVDAGGWFSTGDIGFLDAEGYLFVVDRLKDVFKVDNWLVAPSEIEEVLRQHPGVADCVVVDRPDEFSGAAAHGLVVAKDPGADPAGFAEFVNARVPYYERLRTVELVDRIPRSPIGKIQRRAVRERLPGPQCSTTPEEKTCSTPSTGTP
ncbi:MULTISPECIES: class I adenylate-forming enzyme family protein [Amycolatopsis]|uniref:class I adenylate-forming enzyme family protein n=1 Tax=Amycolatopsis TaxID=1813 RepID=UPI0007DF317B|nr:class I adenylate-forming enzyme family protein [Amycolatopsis sp. M39]OAP22619.1 Long-chain-fatty-acid--CoA ligase [Amycolatopsis sp. M39]